MPPLSAGQFYIVEAVDEKHGYRQPVAAVTWAFVSEELDSQLQQHSGSLPRLRPEQWKCGAIAWLIDAVGDVRGVRTAMQWLATGPFKERELKIATRRQGAVSTVATLDALLAERAEVGGLV
jgi:hemolysin-activating ACP:hemolysin acyltransferase